MTLTEEETPIMNAAGSWILLIYFVYLIFFAIGAAFLVILLKLIFKAMKALDIYIAKNSNQQ